MPLFKIWSADRKLRKMVVASDYNDLIEKGNCFGGANINFQLLNSDDVFLHIM